MSANSAEILFDRRELPALAGALGPDGIGAFIIKNAIAEGKRQLILPHLDMVAWRDNHASYTNERGMLIDQRHDVCAFRLRIGDQQVVPEFMRELADMITAFVHTLGSVFPALDCWGADEVSMHRYDDPLVGLSRHRDNRRFWGLVPILTLAGSSDFVIYQDGKEYAHRVQPGDLALMRATNLTGDHADSEYQVRMNPEHGVVNVVGLPRVSLIVRDTLLPAEHVKGFSYDNWGPSLVL